MAGIFPKPTAAEDPAPSPRVNLGAVVTPGRAANDRWTGSVDNRGETALASVPRGNLMNPSPGGRMVWAEGIAPGLTCCVARAGAGTTAGARTKLDAAGRTGATKAGILVLG